MAEGDILDGGRGNPPPPPDPNRPRKITCEFCECELGSSGEYKKLSDKAKGFRKAEETIADLEGTISTLRQEIEDLKAKGGGSAPRVRSGIAL